MGILKDIEKHQKSKIFPNIVIGIILFIVIGFIAYGSFSIDNEENTVAEIKTYSVNIGNLKTSISGDGKILYKEDFNINFPITGTVQSIKKQEGDEVKEGEIIATIDTTYLQFNVDKADIALKKAYSDLESKKNQYTSSDIKLSEEHVNSAIAGYDNIKINGEIDISNTKTALETSKINVDTVISDLNIAKSNLELIKKQEDQKYNNIIEDIVSIISINNSFIEERIMDMDELLGVTNKYGDKSDSYQNELGALNTETKNLAITTISQLNKSFKDFNVKWKEYRKNTINTKTTLEFLGESFAISKTLNKSLLYTLNTLKSSVSSSNLTETILNNFVKNYEDELIENKKKISLLIEGRQDAEEQLTNLETKTLTQNNIILGLKSKLTLANKQLEQADINYNNAQKKAENNLLLAQKQIDISNISLSMKKEEVSYDELTPFYSNIESTKKNLEEAKSKLNDALLISPINGKIVKINGNIGSFVGGDKETSFVTITNSNQFYIESFVEELDITRIKDNATVYLTFDALEGVKLTGTVYYISDKSTTDSNGIVTYKVEIGFDPKESGVKEGMTTYIEYITNEVKNVKIIPVESVKPVDGKPSVLLPDNTWKPVITGFTDGKMVEIISGLEKGDKINY